MNSFSGGTIYFWDSPGRATLKTCSPIKEYLKYHHFFCVNPVFFICSAGLPFIPSPRGMFSLSEVENLKK
jgi:hypothetical protein